MIRIVSAVALAAVLAWPCVSFAGASGERHLELDKVLSQQRELRQQLDASNGDFRGLSYAQQRELRERQDGLFRLMEGKASSADLTEQEQLTAFNSLEWISATLNADPDEQMICRREKPVGTNRSQRVCRTVRQMREMREAAQRDVSSFQGMTTP